MKLKVVALLTLVLAEGEGPVSSKKNFVTLYNVIAQCDAWFTSASHQKPGPKRSFLCNDQLSIFGQKCQWQPLPMFSFHARLKFLLSQFMGTYGDWPPQQRGTEPWAIIVIRRDMIFYYIPLRGYLRSQMSVHPRFDWCSAHCNLTFCPGIKIFHPCLNRFFITLPLSLKMSSWLLNMLNGWILEFLENPVHQSIASSKQTEHLCITSIYTMYIHDVHAIFAAFHLTPVQSYLVCISDITTIQWSLYLYFLVSCLCLCI